MVIVLQLMKYKDLFNYGGRMKTIKLLCILFVVTAVTGTLNIFASTYPVMQLVNKVVPGLGGTWNTSNVDISVAEMGRHHMINNVSVTRELDVRVRKFTSSGEVLGSWKTLSSGAISQLTNSTSSYALYMQGGTFDLIFGSRWYYTGNTTINTANWYLDSLTN